MKRKIFRTAVVILLVVFCAAALFSCAQDGAAADASAEAEAPQIAGDNAFTAVLKPSVSWQSDGRYFVKYELTIKNAGERDVSGWTMEIPAADGADVSDEWNCTALADGRQILVSPEDYTKQLYPGQEKTNMGFIVSFAEESLLNDFSSEVTFGEETLIYEGKAEAPAAGGGDESENGNAGEEAETEEAGTDDSASESRTEEEAPAEEDTSEEAAEEAVSE